MTINQIDPPGFDIADSGLEFERYPQINPLSDNQNIGSSTESYEWNGGAIGWLNDDDNVCSWSSNEWSCWPKAFFTET